jgi:hypothetical protein
MMRTRFGVVTLLFVAAAATAVVEGGTKIKTVPDKTFNFTGLKTMDWHPEGRGSLQLQLTTGEKPEDLKARFFPIIDQQIERAFPARGFPKPASGAPDLWVHYYVLIRIGTSSQEMGQFLPNNAYWGIPLFTPNTTSINMFETGTIVLDVASVKTKAMVWRGIASAEIDRLREPAERDKRIRDAIDGMVKKFPK